MEKSDEVIVKNEPIYESQSIPEIRKDKRQSNKVKKEPIENEMQTSKSHIEVKAEEKFSSSREEVVSIGFMNEKKATTSNNEPTKLNSNALIDKQRFKCDFCQKRFNQSSNLVVHLRTHTGEKPYECEVCKKRFSTLYSLGTHRRIHNGEKPYECDFCKKRFHTSSAHIYHRKTHTGEKPYQCDVCQKSFIQSINLEYHRIIHTSERAFECDVCKKRFSTSRILDNHRRIHAREKPFEC